MTNRIAIALGFAVALALTGSANAGVVKTKTKSNQSNDRIAHSDVAAALEAAFDAADTNKDGQLDGSEQMAIKTRTKSNNINERCAGACPADQGGEAEAPGAPLKGVDVKLGRGASERMLQVVFSANLDSDGNGLVSRAEWLADGLAQFDRADTDHDGTLSQAEAAKAGWNIKSTEVR